MAKQENGKEARLQKDIQRRLRQDHITQKFNKHLTTLNLRKSLAVYPGALYNFCRRLGLLPKEAYNLVRIKSTAKIQPKRAKIRYNFTKSGVCIGSDECQ